MPVAPVLQCASAGETFGEVLAVRRLPSFLLRESRYPASLDLPCHRHPGFYLAYVVRGSIDERNPSLERHFTAGSLHLHGAGEPHSGRTGADGITALSVIPSAAIAERIPADERRLREPDGPALAALAARCQREMVADDTASDLALESLALELIARLLRTPWSRERGAPAWLHAVRDYLHAHRAERVRLAVLSGVAGIHEVHLVRAFRRRFGVTPGVYLRRLRIEDARRTLLDRECPPLADLALALGFSSQAHFSRVFRDLVGTSPAAFRRQHGSGPSAATLRSDRARTLRS